MYESISNITSIFFSAILTVCMWKIFEDNGEKGWKSLIPFYSTITFGKIFGEEKLAKKIVIWVLVLLAFLFGGLFCLVLGGEGNNDGMTVAGMVLLVISMALLIYLFVLEIKFYNRFAKFCGAPTWWSIVWVLLSPVAAIYFAFVHKRYDIPGITEVEDED